MRTSTAVAVLAGVSVLAASQASAFAIDMVARGPTSGLAVSDTVTVDVFLDADPGLVLLSVAVLGSSSAVLDYDVPATLARERCDVCSGSSTSGAQPSYILYVASKTSRVLYPVQTPYFPEWPAPPPGELQVNINYAEASLFPNPGFGTGIWIATMVFRVSQDFDTETLSLSLDTGLGGPPGVQTGTGFVPPGEIGLSAPIVLTGTVPEPGTLVLLGVGVALVAALGGRRT